jgi:hypothetical protein
VCFFFFFFFFFFFANTRVEDGHLVNQSAYRYSTQIVKNTFFFPMRCHLSKNRIDWCSMLHDKLESTSKRPFASCCYLEGGGVSDKHFCGEATIYSAELHWPQLDTTHTQNHRPTWPSFFGGGRVLQWCFLPHTFPN